MKFVSRTLIILLALYGLVFAVGDAYLAHMGAPVWLAVVFAIGFIGLQFLVAPYIISFFLDIVWDDQQDLLPQVNRDFVNRLCTERGLKIPRIGIIYGGTPNAFSFGHVPSNARVVVTQGLIDVLTPEEVNAVLAHEIGHVEHWDFAVMMVAALAPLIIYQLYAFTRNNSNTRVIAYGAYLCYLVSQFVVLLLNRTREYYADHYSAEVTRKPDDLSSALIKIAYGMVREEGEYKRIMKEGDKEEKSLFGKRRRIANSLGLMGISNLRAGQSLALASANPAEAAAVMQWDLVNPWARVYELNSTHPLTARRVLRMNHEAAEMHQIAQYPLPEDRRVRRGRFPLEFLLWAIPFVGWFLWISLDWYPELSRFLHIELPPNFTPMLFMFTAAIWILRTMYRYSGTFSDTNVGTLLEDMEVSEMQCRAVRLRGEILGRGVPGAFWSPDLVLRDETGLVFLLYRQSIPFSRFLFAISDAESLIGDKVEVEGWFRRGMTPYVEMSKLTGSDGKVRRTYSRWVQYALSVLVIAVSWYWMTLR